MPTASILIIDGDRLNRWSLRRILEGAGYRVDEAVSVAAARERFPDPPPDLLLLDLDGAGGDDLLLLAALLGSYPPIPVLAMTPDPATAEALALRGLAAAGQLEKPWEAATLLESVAAALAAHP